MARTLPSELTDRQRAILCFICETILKRGYTPSYRELMQEFGMKSLGSIRYHILSIARKGYLQHEYGKHRSLRPTTKGWDEYYAKCRKAERREEV